MFKASYRSRHQRDRETQGLRCLLHAPLLVFLFSGSLSPELALSPGCPLGFSSRIWIPVRLAYSLSVLSPRNHGLLTLKKQNASKERRKEEEHLTGNFLWSTLVPWFILSSKQWCDSYWQLKKGFYVFVKLFFLRFSAFWNSTFIAHTRAE